MYHTVTHGDHVGLHPWGPACRHPYLGLETSTDAKARWERVYDTLTAAGVPVPSGRGNEVLLTLEAWEELAANYAGYREERAT